MLRNFNTPAEKELLQRVAEGDEEAFALIYKDYFLHLLPFAIKLTGTEAEAEEILQETFIKVWLSRDRLPEIENFHAWVLRIAANQSHDALRKRISQRKTIAGLALEETGSTSTELAAGNAHFNELKKLVGEALRLLPEERSAFNDVLELEKVTHGGLPIMISVSGNLCISAILSSNASMFLALHFKLKL